MTAMFQFLAPGLKFCLAILHLRREADGEKNKPKKNLGSVIIIGVRLTSDLPKTHSLK